jgi:hypothetical protein
MPEPRRWLAYLANAVGLLGVIWFFSQGATMVAVLILAYGLSNLAVLIFVSLRPLTAPEAGSDATGGG